MPSVVGARVTGFELFRRSVRNKDISVDTSIETLISLLKRRQIRGSRECAEATAYLLRRVIECIRVGDLSNLLRNVRQVGQRLIVAQPQELAVGNVVRRVLGLIREEMEEDRKGEARAPSDTTSELQPQSPEGNVPGVQNGSPVTGQYNPSPLRHRREESDAPATLVNGKSQGVATIAASTDNSMFSLLAHSVSSLAAAHGIQSLSGQPPLCPQTLANLNAAKDLRAEVIEGVEELIDEIRQADDQIAGYALDYIHSNEIVLTCSSSRTIQKFLLKVAAKRKLTVVHAEAYPNDHEATYETIVGKPKANSARGHGSDQYMKTLTAAGVTVIVIPDSAVFALMARVNKVILDSHIVLANGDFVALSGAYTIAKAAKVHRTPVIALSGVYKVSPVYPFDTTDLMEDGDPGGVVSYEDGLFLDKVDVHNPLLDYVPAGLVDLHVTNLGGHAAPSTQRIVKDHYRDEDLELEKIETSA